MFRPESNMRLLAVNNKPDKFKTNSEKRTLYCWFSHDATKTQTTKLSILLRFYFHDVFEQLKTNFRTNFRFKKGSWFFDRVRLNFQATA